MSIMSDQSEMAQFSERSFDPSEIGNSAEETIDPSSFLFGPNALGNFSLDAPSFSLSSNQSINLSSNLSSSDDQSSYLSDDGTSELEQTWDNNQTLNQTINQSYDQSNDQPNDQSIDQSNNESDDLYQLPSNHPLLVDANNQLKSNLQEKDHTISQLLNNQTISLSNLQSKRTDLGVQLYTAQQQLANAQTSFEKQIQTINQSTKESQIKEQELNKAILSYNELIKQSTEQSKHYATVTKELDELQSIKQRIIDYEKSIDDSITVAKSTNQSIEQSINQSEIKKNQQDEALAELSAKILALENEKIIIEQQINNQSKDNQTIKQTIKEMVDEIRLIHIESKEYRSRWQATLAATEARHQAINQAINQLNENKQELRTIMLIEQSIKQSIKQSEIEHNQLTEFKLRLESEDQYLINQSNLINDLSNKYAQQLEMIISRTSTLEDQFKKQSIVNQSINSEIARLNNESAVLSNKRVELESIKQTKLDSERTIEKGSEQLYAALKQSINQTNGQSINQSEVENECARVELDLVHTSHQCNQLNQTINQYQTEITEKDALVEKYSKEQDKRHDLIEKKQLHVTRLNKEIEKIMESNQSKELDPNQSGGPIEMQIRRARRALVDIAHESESYQREWIKAQARTVTAAGENAEIEQEMAELRAKQSILINQSNRYSAEIEKIVRAKNELENSIRAMSNGGQSMNQWIAQLNQSINQSHDANRNKQAEFVALLGEKQEEAIEQANKINQSINQTEQLKQELLAVEFNCMQWQQKIAIEQETQAILDPNVGQEELEMLSRDVESIKQSIDQARKALQHATEEMNNKVRSTIEARCAIAPIATKQKKNIDRTNMKQSIQSINQSIKRKKQELIDCLKQVDSLESDFSLVRGELDRQQWIYNQSNNQLVDLSHQCELRAIELKIVKEQILIAQKRGTKMEEKCKAAGRIAASNPGTQPTFSHSHDEQSNTQTSNQIKMAKLQQEIAHNDDTFSRLIAVVSQLTQEHPGHKEWGQRMMTLV